MLQLPLVLILLGAALVVVGTACLSLAWAVIVLGVLLAAGGLDLARRSEPS